MVVKFGQHYNVGEKPTVILHTNINRHAGTPNSILFLQPMIPPSERFDIFPPDREMLRRSRCIQI